MDPLAEEKPWQSPYVFCRNNPVRFIDPDGRDEWEINLLGEIIERIKNTKQDSFHIVDADGNRTTKEDGSENSIVFEYGTVKDQFEIDTRIEGYAPVDVFKIEGDDNAARLFEFLADPGKTTDVEWTHAKIGKVRGEKGINIVGTSQSSEYTAVSSALLNNNYHIAEDNHNHPSRGSMGRYPSGSDGRALVDQQRVNPDIKVHIYIKEHGYTPYATREDQVKFYVPFVKYPKK